MKVLKFGGTSLGTAQRIKSVASIINQESEQCIVVLSAMSGTTNILVRINELSNDGLLNESLTLVDKLHAEYKKTVNELLNTPEFQSKGIVFINQKFDEIRDMINNRSEIISKRLRSNAVLAQGELISTQLMQFYFEQEGELSRLCPALDFMYLNAEGEIDYSAIQQYFQKLPKENGVVSITQGFICRNQYGEISNLERGGSDYTASLIGAALNAQEIQIWTDIDGIHNNDPRFVDGTRSLKEICFEEAAELAYFGAKILHPQSVIPAMQNNIPVWIKNTFEPELHGTKISNSVEVKPYSAIAAKDNIVAIRIQSYRMLMAYGFLKKVFEVFEKNQTSIDMITTSEVAVSLTIDNTQYLESILRDLEEFGKVEVDRQQTIICIAGDFGQGKYGTSKPIFEALENISVRMISYGGSDHNVSVLIDTEDKQKALNSLNKHLF
jgi:aspartate kinase